MAYSAEAPLAPYCGVSDSSCSSGVLLKNNLDPHTRSLDPSQPAATSRLSAHINNPGPGAVIQQEEEDEKEKGAVPETSTAAHH